MTRKTQGVRDLVSDVIATLARPYGEDIIEDVFLAIERDRRWHEPYQHLCTDLSGHVVNEWVGKYTKEIAGMKTIREVDAERSSLIKNYTKLAHSQPSPAA